MFGDNSLEAVATAETFTGCVNIVKVTKPTFIILENVPRLGAPGQEEDACLEAVKRLL